MWKGISQPLPEKVMVVDGCCACGNEREVSLLIESGLSCSLRHSVAAEGGAANATREITILHNAFALFLLLNHSKRSGANGLFLPPCHVTSTQRYSRVTMTHDKIGRAHV